MKLKRLSVATPSSSARMIALPRIQRAPASTPPSACSACGGSGASTRLMKNADQTYENASIASAYGPRSSCTSTPPRLVPARNENARLPCESELAAT